MNTTFSDEQLFALAKNMDEDAFRVIFDRYYIALCRYAYLFTSSENDAEEAVLDVFTVLWRKGSSLNIDSSFRQYIFRAVRNRSLNYLRRGKKESGLSEFEQTVLSMAETDTTAFAELMEIIEQAILSLPDKCALVFRKSRLEGMSHRDISLELQISEKTVEAHIAKALVRIRQYLRDSSFFSFFF